MEKTLKNMCSYVSINSEIKQNSKPKKLREMVTYVPDDENGARPKRNMVEIVDNSQGRTMCTFVPEVSQLVPTTINKPALSQNAMSNMASSYLNSTEFKYENGIMYLGNIPFINCSIEIVEAVYSESDEYYRCKICVGDRVIFKDVKSDIFPFSKWLLKNVGIALIGDRSVASNCLHQYLDYLTLNLDMTKKSFLYQKPGWRLIDNKLFYVTPQGIINGQFIKAASECGQKFTSLEPNYKAFAEYLSMSAITRSPVASILVLYTAMSVMNSLYRKANFTPKFLLFVHGFRGSYKTSLSLALSQIEYKDAPLFTLKATKAGIESCFREYKDAIMLVDDLAPTNQLSDRRKMESTLETIVRAFGDGTAHRRCVIQHSDDKAAKIGQYEAEGGCVITGEYFSGCESSLARCLFIALKKEDVDVDLLSCLQDRRHIVENFVVCLVSCLTHLMNECNVDIINLIETKGKEIRKKFSFRFSNERYSEYIAQLHVALEILICVAKYFKLLDQHQIEFFSEKFSSAIMEVVEENNARLVAQNPVTVLCNAIKLAITDELVPYCALGSTVLDNDNVIFHDDDSMYITQKCCNTIVNNYIKENDINLAEFTPTRVAETLESSHVIKVIMEGIVAGNVDVFSENVFGIMVHLFLDLQRKMAQNLKIRIDRLDSYLLTALGSISHIKKNAIQIYAEILRIVFFHAP